MTDVRPDMADYLRVEREEGPTPRNATVAERARRYQLAQAAKLIRLHETGQPLPDEPGYVDTCDVPPARS